MKKRTPPAPYTGPKFGPGLDLRALMRQVERRLLLRVKAFRAEARKYVRLREHHAPTPLGSAR